VALFQLELPLNVVRLILHDERTNC
jgi:hypothetical protein